mmetsp:Transcript_88264/g.263196  ORF Transcript_88264/g.263196 Transcript_88264/m.263196 type:complete len:304 (+) Transcript_88264:853-1764(+)
MTPRRSKRPMAARAASTIAASPGLLRAVPAPSSWLQPNASSKAAAPAAVVAACQGGTSSPESSWDKSLWMLRAVSMTRQRAESRIAFRRFVISDTTDDSKFTDSWSFGGSWPSGPAEGTAPGVLKWLMTSISLPPNVAYTEYLCLRLPTSSMPASILRMRMPSFSMRRFQSLSRCCSVAFVFRHHSRSCWYSMQDLWNCQSQMARLATTITAPAFRETICSESSSVTKALRCLLGAAKASSAACTGSQICGLSRFRAATLFVSCMPKATMPFARSSFSVFLIFFVSAVSADFASWITGLRYFS